LLNLLQKNEPNDGCVAANEIRSRIKRERGEKERGGGWGPNWVQTNIRKQNKKTNPIPTK
jgi:hypothetical protein